MYRCFSCDDPAAAPDLDTICDVCLEKRQANAEEGRERARQRARARRDIYAAGNLPQSFGMLIRYELADRDGPDCGVCGDPVEPLKAHVDHIVPISKGGLHVWENVRLTHPFCNMSKHNR